MRPRSTAHSTLICFAWPSTRSRQIWPGAIARSTLRAGTAGGDYIDPFGGMGTCIRDGCGCCRAGVRRGSAADAPHCWLASELSSLSIPESAMAARAGSVVLDRTAPERIFAELKRVVIADRALDGLRARCQMPLPEARENGSESRGCDSRSAPLRQTSATNLVRESADFGWAGRDAAKNTTLLALIDTLGGRDTVSPERSDLLGVEDRHYHPPRRTEHTRAVSQRRSSSTPEPERVSESMPVRSRSGSSSRWASELGAAASARDAVHNVASHRSSTTPGTP